MGEASHFGQRIGSTTRSQSPASPLSYLHSFSSSASLMVAVCTLERLTEKHPEERKREEKLTLEGICFVQILEIV
jgi:hypothetical protein